jgi:hypothetical protein
LIGTISPNRLKPRLAATLGLGGANMPLKDGEDPQSFSVEGLPNFPFLNFHDFQAACATGHASPFFDGLTASRWVEAGPHVSRGLELEALALAFLPWLAFIAFAVYATMRHPFLLFATPLLVIGYFLFNPGMLRLFRIFVWVPLAVVLCLFTWALVTGRSELDAVTAAALVI